MKLTTRDKTEPVTTIVQQDVLPGKDAAFETWSKAIRMACRTYAGYLGSEIIKPVGEGGTYITIFRFDSYANLEIWMQSEERQKHLSSTADFCAAPPRISQYRSLEFMFPVDAGGKPPSRERMAVVTYLGLIAPVYFVPGLVREYVTTQPLVATMLSLAVITPTMVYAIMPVLTRLFRPFLNRSA